MESFMNLGDYLYHLVRSRGLNMHDFAEACDCSPSSLSRIRTGKRIPRKLPVERWCQVLDLTDEEQQQLHELAMLSQAPAAVRNRISQMQANADAERNRRRNIEQQYGDYRKGQGYYDGYWLAYNYSLFGDGRILRSMAQISDNHITWINKESGEIQYSYHGHLDLLGDKVFIRLEEDRGDSEFVQITLHSLFDFQEPAFLYGIITGISGKSIRHPISNPAASKMLMIHIGSNDKIQKDPQLLEHLEGLLGNYLPSHIGHYYPQALGSDKTLRDCLHLQKREDLDACIERMLSNHSERDGVLAAAFE